MNKFNIILADDHKIVRDGISAMLEDEPQYQIIGEAGNGREALELCKNNEVDVIIMDLNMPEVSGLEAIEQIKKEYPKIKILALTMLSQNEAIKNTVSAGVNGYVLKSSNSEDVLEALDTIISGGHYFCEETTKTIMEGLAGVNVRKTLSIEEITPREKDVLQLICDEMTAIEISEELVISVRTVDSHRRNLLQKTGAKNTVGLVKFALKTGLVKQ